MTHEDKGHYSKKHGSNRSVDPKIKEAIFARTSEGTISCSAAFRIVEELKVAPKEVGVGIDLLEVSIVKCQLGLFGYGEQRSIIKASDSVSPELEESIRNALDEGRLSCTSAWNISQRHDLGKREIADACEKLAIKIYGCQLGAF